MELTLMEEILRSTSQMKNPLLEPNLEEPQEVEMLVVIQQLSLLVTLVSEQPKMALEISSQSVVKLGM
jgi:hypothetical protein